MNCPIENRNPDVLMAYVAGQLDTVTSGALERHLAGCAACRSLAGEQAALWKTLDAWEAPAVSLDFDRRLYHRIGAEAPASLWQRITGSFRFMPFRQALPLTAVAGLLLMAGVIMRHPDSNVPVPLLRETVRADQVERTLDDLELLRQFGAASSSSPESGHSDAM
jgi:anti-sigma factor RsiW